MVKQSPNHQKVDSLTPATGTGTRREKKDKKLIIKHPLAVAQW